jgi:hypothetical protein
MARIATRISTLALLASLSLFSLACGDDDTEAAPDAGTPDATVEDVELTVADFDCIKDWDMVRMFRITNVLGHKDEALAVAAAGEGDYPVGTVIQLVWFEAMVKRRPGYSPASQDWEFIAFKFPHGTKEIVARGGDDSVKNVINGESCLGCHSGAEAKFDLICEKTHGCDPLGVPDETILAFQNGDPSCVAPPATAR